jgi:NitT/TauT family transport system substrate-binding protein
MFKKAITAILMGALLFTLASCGTKRASEETQPAGNDYKARTVRIAYTESYTSVIPQLMQSKGFLENKLPDDVKVEWRVIPSGADVRDALISDNLDFGIMGKGISIPAIENGVPVMIMSDNPFMTIGLFSGNDSIKSLDDISGQNKIATLALGTTTHFSLIATAKELYGDAARFGDDHFTMLTLADTMIALENKSVDCALVNFPFDIAAKKINGVHEILDLTPYSQKYGITGNFTVRQGFYEENPALVDIMYSAMEETKNYANSNPAEAARILAEFYGNVDAADIENQIRTVPLTIEVSESAYDNFADLLYELGKIPNPPKKFSELPNYDRIPKKP